MSNPTSTGESRACCPECWSGDERGCLLHGKCPCHPIPARGEDQIPWIPKGRDNLISFARQYPDRVEDAIDAAYLAGLDDKATLLSQLEAAAEKRRGTGGATKNWNSGYDDALDDFVDIIRSYKGK